MISPSLRNKKIIWLKDKSATALPLRQVGGIILLLLAIVVWGTNWPVMKLGLEHITPLWFSALRFALGGLCLFFIQIVTGTLKLPQRRDVPLLFSVGLLQMLTFTALGAIAMTEIPAGRSAILAYTTPLWVLPGAILLFRQRVTRQELIGTLLGIAGVAILFNPLTLDWTDTKALQANTLLLIASFCWAICILHLRHHRGASSAYHLAPWQMLIATVPLIIIAWYKEGPYTGDNSLRFWEISLFVGPLATAFCFCAVNAASQWISSTSMASSMLGVPVVGLFISILFLNESLSAGLVASVVAIIAGMLVVTLNKPRPRAD
ncbi:EamA family transporter [Brenneria goodwinii]|uniref:DMT family transporter n=1 Tax=Brenneria goodwinii TaxID=1109412 RepID=UPI000EF26C7D|nr:DMT family transporter [Brenneria goodwinii]MCG8157352.1 EamA family transporter [Brenneria goodwinii]MCG8163207.1 EamA family transporter [Brenneria goodwinii]MCG8165166.1 EamA family transporter [Brenneria goodwinii]MCG8170866.1 EamA family transporter [Brenneria goodwinii]MCG8175933.1 EamA family transporter [Brenneria goodwinii]